MAARKLSVLVGDPFTVSPNAPLMRPPIVSVPRPTPKVVFAPSVMALLIRAAVPADTELVTFVPAAVLSPKALPPITKSPAVEASLMTTARFVSSPMSSFGANAPAFPANPGVLVSNTSVSPLAGVVVSVQFPAALQLLPAAPVQCSTRDPAPRFVRVTAVGV